MAIDWSVPVPNEDAEIRKWNYLILKFVKRLAYSGISEEDTISEMYEALLRAVRTYSITGGAAKSTWYYLHLLSASRSLYRKHMRTKRQIKPKSNSRIDESIDTVSIFGIDDEVCDLAMENLGPKQRRVIWMRMFEGKSRTAIAQELQVVAETVRTIEKQAIRIMRKTLEERGIFDIYDARHADGSSGEFDHKELPDETTH